MALEQVWLVTIESTKGARRKVVVVHASDLVARAIAADKAGTRWNSVAVELAMDSNAGRKAYAEYLRRKNA